MHNLHFIVVCADSAEEAAESVSSEILEWGNENNWRSIGGIASEDGKDDIANKEKARWGLDFLDDEPDEGDSYFQKAIQYHHKQIRSPISLSLEKKQQFNNFDEALQAAIADMQKLSYATATEFAFFKAELNIKHLSQIFAANKELESGDQFPEFYSWKFNHYGLTDFTSMSDGKQKYIVFLDMHS